MIIKICVGSSCHLKGSYEVVEAMKEIVKKHEVEDLVELQASFCLGQCAKGVSVKVEELEDGVAVKESASVSVIEGGMLLHCVNAGNAEELFVKEVLPLIKK